MQGSTETSMQWHAWGMSFLYSFYSNTMAMWRQTSRALPHAAARWKL